jgi:hypothetical protein
VRHGLHRHGPVHDEGQAEDDAQQQRPGGHAITVTGSASDRYKPQTLNEVRGLPKRATVRD